VNITKNTQHYLDSRIEDFKQDFDMLYDGEDDMKILKALPGTAETILRQRVSPKNA